MTRGNEKRKTGISRKCKLQVKTTVVNPLILRLPQEEKRGDFSKKRKKKKGRGLQKPAYSRFANQSDRA